MKIGAAAREDPPENLNTLPETPRIAGLSGMGGGIHGSMQHWLYPLPAGERWTLVVEWLARGIPESRVSFDARPVHEAVAASAGDRCGSCRRHPEGAEYGWFGVRRLMRGGATAACPGSSRCRSTATQ